MDFRFNPRSYVCSSHLRSLDRFTSRSLFRIAVMSWHVLIFQIAAAEAPDDADSCAWYDPFADPH